MFDYNDALEILLAAGVDVPPTGAPGPTAEALALKIANDGLVAKRAFDLAVSAFVATAVRQMSEPEKLVLRKRIGGLPAVPPAATEVKWTLFESQLSSGVVAILGSTPRESIRFTESPAVVRQITWKGSKPPVALLDAYEKKYKPHAALPGEYYAAAAVPKEKSRLQVLAEQDAAKLAEQE